MNHLESIINDEFVWNVISTYTMGIARRGTGDFTLKLNCPMCTSRGQSADRRYRCGIIHTGDHIGLNCFNCGFTSRFIIGSPLSRNMMAFLSALGVPDREVRMIQYRALEIAKFTESVKQVQPEYVPVPQFYDIDLPPGSQPLEHWANAGCMDADYLAVVDYLLNKRGDVAAEATTYYWTPDTKHEMNRHLIIPCLHDGHLVGWIGRCIDPDTKRKYFNQTPKGFLFNADSLSKRERKYAFIVEGVFDALVIDAVGAMGANLNPQQVRWIEHSNKQPVVVPDRDEAGKRLIDVALRHGWSVSIPNYGGRHWWEGQVKDVDEAVQRYGKLYTLRSIVENITSDPYIIRQRANYTKYRI
jgi:hypothetical protein